MTAAIGLLRNYWHVIALSRELKQGRAVKRKLYGQPLLIWRDLAGQVHALADCCAHRRAPLLVQDFRDNRVVCPYHGWQYDHAGSLCHVPSNPDGRPRVKCAIPSYQTLDLFGFVWIHLGMDDQSHAQLADLRALLEFDEVGAWPVTYLQKEFATTDELLIDNFMDPTHTAVVHDGLIRSSHETTVHEMTVTTHSQGVRVDFAEREERVGVGMRLLFGSSMRVKHCDEFLLPNLVRVTYTINDKRCFVALIACTPLESLNSCPTLALVQLRYNFGWPTRLIGPVVAWLARKVLKQDYHITAQQFANISAFSEATEQRVASDTVAVRVSQLRRQLLAGDAPGAGSSQTLQLRF